MWLPMEAWPTFFAHMWCFLVSVGPGCLYATVFLGHSLPFQESSDMRFCRPEVWLPTEPSSTFSAHVGFVSCVCTLVSGDICHPQFVLGWLLQGTCPTAAVSLWPSEMLLLIEASPTFLTHILTFYVCSLVSDDTWLPTEALTTSSPYIGLFLCCVVWCLIRLDFWLKVAHTPWKHGHGASPCVCPLLSVDLWILMEV